MGELVFSGWRRAEDKMGSILERLAAKYPGPERLGQHVLVPFSVRKLDRARLLWLNDRWFRESGVPIEDPAVATDLTRELLEKFAVAPMTKGEGNDDATLYADRYGGVGSSPHGGSGRCGLSYGFHGKGIGPTPLVSTGSDWHHSNGCMSLGEALREVVSSEIAGAELPFGAIPIVAIIDAGTYFSRVRNEPGERRAIIVRPNFIRPAHFERAVFNVAANDATNGMSADALRTEEAITAVASRPKSSNECAIPFPGVREMFLKIAQQTGAARAHRLWQGRFMSGNVTINGAVADLGSFRAVPSWRLAIGEPEERFGDDTHSLTAAINSMCFHFGKYAPQSCHLLRVSELVREVLDALRSTFTEACASQFAELGILDMEGLSALREFFCEYFTKQQRERVQLGAHRKGWMRPWLFHALTASAKLPEGVSPQDSKAARSLRDIFRKYAAVGADDAEAVLVAVARRWLWPRPLMYYEIAVPRSVRVASRIVGNPDADRSLVQQFISSTLTRSRRIWRGFPQALHVTGQFCDVASAALYCENRLTGAKYICLEGRTASSHAIVLGQPLRLASLDAFSPSIVGGVARATIPVTSEYKGDSCSLDVGGETLRIPTMTFRYDAFC